MTKPFRGLGLRAAGLLVLCSMPAAATDAPKSIDTGGSGTVTMCRSWFFFNSCQSYNHVALPDRVKIGDSLDLIFGSNTKHIIFDVVRIAHDGERCTVYNDVDTGSEQVDRVEIEACRLARP